jgi:LysR family hydrogen peroxide-inducible transcriptional activator
MDLSALTIQQLRYVVAVERHRSFRDAALASHVSQPALSMQIKKLEELLDVCVFDRSKQPVIVTEKGSRVVAQAKLALEHFERIGSAAGRQEELSGTFRLGIIPTLLPTLVPLFLSPFARAYPRVDLEIVEAKTTTLLRGLREGAIDGGLAATPLEVAGVHERVICHEGLFVYLPEGHALLSHGRIRQADLMDEHVWLLSEGHCFRTQVLHLCSADRRHGGRQGSVQCECGSFETLIGIVDSGFGVTVVPELVVRSLPAACQAAQVRPFAIPEPMREISFLHAREQERVEVADALIGSLRSALPPDLVGRKPRRSSVLKPVRTPRT